MTTIAQVVIEASLDTTRLQQGFSGAEGRLREYQAQVNIVKEVTTLYNAAQREMERLAGESANAVSMTTSEMRKWRAELDLARTKVMDLDEALSLAKNEMTALKPPTDAMARTLALAEIQAYKLDAAMRTAASSANAMAMTNALQRTGAIAEEAGMQFSTLGRRGAQAGVALAFGMEQLANGSETGMRRSLRAVASFGFAFGPEGMIVSALAVGTLAVMDFFRKAEKEAEAFHKKLAGMANESRADDIMGAARDAMLGRPMDAKTGDVAKPSQFVKGAFEGSLADLRAHKEMLDEMARNAPNVLAGAAIVAGKEYRQLTRDLEPLEKKFKDIQTAALNVANRPADNEGKLLGMSVTADLPDQKDHSKRDWSEHIQTLRAAIDAYKDLEQEHVLTATSGTRLLSVYRQVGDELAKQKDQYGTQANDLIKLRLEMEKTAMMQTLMAKSQLSTIPSSSAAQSLAGDPNDPFTSLQALLARKKTLEEIATINRTSDRGPSYAPTLDAIRLVEASVNRIAAIEGDTNRVLEARRAILADRPRQDALAARMAGGDTNPALLLNDAVASANQSRQIANAAKVSGAENAPELEAAANRARTEAESRIKAIIVASQQWKSVTAEERAELAGLLGLLGQLGDKTVQAGSAWDGVKMGIHGVLDAASGLNKIPRWLNDGVNAAEHMIDSIKAIEKAKDAIAKQGDAGGGIFGSIGNIASMMGPIGSAVGSAIGIAGAIGGMFRQHDEALDKNTARLDALRNAMVDTGGLSGQATAMRDIQQWLASGKSGSGPNQGLDAIVTQSGLTIAQFNKMATDLGITFGKGTDWVSQFGTALQLAIQAANKFGTSLSDQTALADLRLKVNGTTTPVAQIKEQLDLLGQFSPALRAQIGSIDTATVEGRSALRQALKNLVDQITAGTLTPEQLGKLSGVKDLATIIGNLAGGLDSLTASVGAAAAAINGVGWYKVNQAVYAITPAQTGVTSVATPPPVISKPAGQGTTVAKPTSATTDAGSATFNIGSVSINTPERDPEKLRKVFLTSMQAKSQTLFGTTKQWSQVQS